MATSTFTVTVRDSSSPALEDTQTFVILIAPLLQITTTTPLLDAVVGVVYTQPLAASGGTGTPTWGVTTGSLPDGLTLSSSGVISGTPTTSAVSTFTVRASDAGAPAQVAFQALQIRTALPLQITTASPLPNAVVGFAYSQPLAAGGGTGPYTWRHTGGSLPPGLLWLDSGRL